MKQEFITSHGKVVIERDKIFVLEDHPGQLVSDVYLFVFFLLQISAIVLNVPEMKWMALVFGTFYMINKAILYFKFKNQSFKSRILIKQVNDTAFEDDKNGIDTWVKLHLDSGKIRYIKFRKLENQYQPFIEAVSHQIFLLRSAV